MVLQAKVLTGLLDNGSDLGIVPLVDPREEMVGGLVVECTCDQCPEPAVSGIVLSCSHLHLSPLVYRCWGGGGGGGAVE